MSIGWSWFQILSFCRWKTSLILKGRDEYFTMNYSKPSNKIPCRICAKEFHTTYYKEWNSTNHSTNRWQQFVTPIILGQISNLPFSFYPMWYNVIPPYLPFDPSLYPRYFSGMKMFEHVYPIIIIGYPYPRLDKPIVTTSNTPYSIGI